ncbi:MAG TPA: Zn-ribbon domain-containing OB-fold protein [Rugosimonospora sp.]|nr:Zn-ribbon domain-containing OB-fold protein [Rugosimonospora sp.]
MSPLPVPDYSANGEAPEHLDGLRAGRLVLPRCTRCGVLVWYPRAFCPACGTDEVEWVDVDGSGRVHSFAVVRKGTGAYADAGPYVVAYVDLDAGPRILTNVVGDPDAVTVDAPVTAVFDRADSGAVLLRFALREPHQERASVGEPAS